VNKKLSMITLTEMGILRIISRPELNKHLDSIYLNINIINSGTMDLVEKANIEIQNSFDKLNLYLETFRIILYKNLARVKENKAILIKFKIYSEVEKYLWAQIAIVKDMHNLLEQAVVKMMDNRSQLSNKISLFKTDATILIEMLKKVD